MVGTSTAMGSTASIDIGGSRLASSDWLRLYAILGSIVGLLLVLVDVTAVHEPDAPGVIVLGLGASVLALAADRSGDRRPRGHDRRAGRRAGRGPGRGGGSGGLRRDRELRRSRSPGRLAILATAWLARPLGDLVSVPAVFGAAYLAFATAVAIRFGAIPFHLWAARVADAAPGVALPLLMAWGPAAFAAVALVWIDQSVAPLVLPFDVRAEADRRRRRRERPARPPGRAGPGRPRAHRRLLDRRRRGLHRPRPRGPRPRDLGALPDLDPIFVVAAAPSPRGSSRCRAASRPAGCPSSPAGPAHARPRRRPCGIAVATIGWPGLPPGKRGPRSRTCHCRMSSRSS